MTVVTVPAESRPKTITLDEARKLDAIGTNESYVTLIRNGYCGCALCAWGRELESARIEREKSNGPALS